jgi:hypothetical protein
MTMCRLGRIRSIAGSFMLRTLCCVMRAACFHLAAPDLRLWGDRLNELYCKLWVRIPWERRLHARSTSPGASLAPCLVLLSRHPPLRTAVSVLVIRKAQHSTYRDTYHVITCSIAAIPYNPIPYTYHVITCSIAAR